MLAAANCGLPPAIVMGLVGGVFFPVEFLPAAVQTLSRLTFQFWARDGYRALLRGGAAGDILPQALILLAVGLL